MSARLEACHADCGGGGELAGLAAVGDGPGGPHGGAGPPGALTRLERGLEGGERRKTTDRAQEVLTVLSVCVCTG